MMLNAAPMTMVLIMTLTVTVLVVVAVALQDDQCIEYQFDHPFIPGYSCEDIYNNNPQARDMSGYYWIIDGLRRVYCGMSHTGMSCEDIYNNNLATRDKSGYYRISNNEWVYCNMTAIAIVVNRNEILSCAGVDGTWKRIASFNITAGDDCPSPWVKSSHNNVSFCIPASTAGGCYSVIYSTNGTSYRNVCGRASGYDKGSMDGFYNSATRDINIESNYVDGLSITHGSPRQHIWTYAVGLTDSGDNPNHNCPCAVVGGPNPPAFVGSHYYCESGAGSNFDLRTYYLSDVLWDGAGCSANNTCCSDPNLPWFYRQLNQTTQDDIEVRMCTLENSANEILLMTKLELYVQ